MEPVASASARRGAQHQPRVSRLGMPDRARLGESYIRVRAQTESLAVPLSAEDQVIQSMPDASPAKWHRAHTTWFFETVILKAHGRGYAPFDARYGYLFNSYYEALGRRHPRPERGLLTRPSCAQIASYRAAVDERMSNFIAQASEEAWAAARPLILLGLHHEQQHQELLLTDILHAFSRNPLLPAYSAPRRPRARTTAPTAPTAEWIAFPGGTVEIGHAGEGFAFDNETPRHAVLLRPFALSSRLVTNGEWLSFMEDGGYRRPALWLSDGWAAVQEGEWNAPLYWREEDGAWRRFSLHGVGALDLAAPVVNISFYEADAFARWAGGRLPTEAEWEAAAESVPLSGTFLSQDDLEPHAADAGDRLAQMFGDAWEWTQSPYAPYPGFRPNDGAISEYNGKFMINQIVLRGGSCLTPSGHVRTSYRNFFYPATRWQFAGLRLAKDV